MPIHYIVVYVSNPLGLGDKALLYNNSRHVWALQTASVRGYYCAIPARTHRLKLSAAFCVLVTSWVRSSENN